MFCGPNKRAKVVRTSLNESVGGWGKMVVVGGGGGAVTQTASLSGLGRSLATVTHGETEPE